MERRRFSDRFVIPCARQAGGHRCPTVAFHLLKLRCQLGDRRPCEFLNNLQPWCSRPSDNRLLGVCRSPASSIAKKPQKYRPELSKTFNSSHFPGKVCGILADHRCRVERVIRLCESPGCVSCDKEWMPRLRLVQRYDAESRVRHSDCSQQLILHGFCTAGPE